MNNSFNCFNKTMFHDTIYKWLLKWVTFVSLALQESPSEKSGGPTSSLLIANIVYLSKHYYSKELFILIRTFLRVIKAEAGVIYSINE